MIKLIHILCFFILLFICNLNVSAQDDLNSLDQRVATEIINEVDFDKTTKEWRLRDIFNVESSSSKSTKSRKFEPRNYTLSNSIMYIAAIILVAMLLFVIFTNINLKKSESIAVEEIVEDDIAAFRPKTAFEQAIEAGDYRMAIRYRFLHVLKNINEKELIKWAFEKTNRDYLREFRGHQLFKEFRQLVNVYEMVWYGNTNIDKTSFEYLDKDFEFFIKQDL